MADLSAVLSQIMNNPESLQQLQSMAASLGLGGGNSPNGPGSGSPSGGSGLDLSALASMLGGGASNAAPTDSASQETSPGQKTAPDFSSLASLLGGGSQKESNNIPNLDMGVILQIQKAISAMNTSNPNMDLLRALKPHFKSERAKKVDDAIRLMQLIQLLPMIKESGLLGNLLGGDNK